MHRAVFSTRTTTTLHSVCFTKETYVHMAAVFAIDGILPLMAQNVQNQRLLKELFTLNRPTTTPFIIAILKATVTRFLKVMYVWDFGLVSVRVMVLEMVTLVGNQCLVLWLKKYHHLKIKWKFNCYLVVAIYRPFGLSINYHTILSQYYNHTVSALVCKQDIITVRISDHVHPAPYIMIHFFPRHLFYFLLSI